MHSGSIIRIALVFVVFILIDLYVFNGFKAGFASGRGRWIGGAAFWGITVAFYLLLLYFFLNYSRGQGPAAPLAKWTMSFFMALYIPKLLMLVFFGIEDSYRLLRAGGVGISSFFDLDWFGATPYFESRRWFFSRAVSFVALVPATAIIYGLTKGKHQFKVHRHDLRFDDLPDAFDGLTITQISDLHVGSLENKSEFARAVGIINELNSDLLFFTGDLVNNKAEEMHPWMDVFKRLKADMGKFAVLGNHDYGDYAEWSSAEEKARNMQEIHQVYDDLDFKLLRNESHRIEKGDEHVEILGMENWGRGFAKYGDMQRTMQEVKKDAFKILLSHDPTHWEEQVKDHDEKIHLTLAGHTHGAQFGVEIPGFRFSPVQLRYKRWAGLYSENDRFLYINRGLGFIGFPGRVGIWPEITVITLNKA